MCRNHTIQVIMCLAFLIVSPALAGTVIYVDKNHAEANDSNPGTEALPLKTIDRAMAIVQPGDHVYIKGSTDPCSPDAVYDRSNKSGFPLVTNGTAENPITIEAYPGHTVILLGNGIGWGIVLNYASYHTFRGLKIQNFIDAAMDDGSVPKTDILIEDCEFTVTSTWGLFFREATNLTIRDCLVHDCQGPGISIRDSSNVLLERVDSYNNWDQDGLDAIALGSVGGDADGFSTTVANNIVFTDCRAWNNTEDGFDLCGDSVLINCLAYDHPGNNFKAFRRTQDDFAPHVYSYYNCVGYGSGERGLITNGCPELHLYNCVIDHSGTYKGAAWSDAEGVRFYNATQGSVNCSLTNCIITNSSLPGVVVDEGGVYVVDCDHNLYYGNTGANSGLHSDTNVLTSNPLFVDVSTGDFNLQSGSPAIDAGIVIDGYHNPTAGPGELKVWYGSAPDIGAYEVALSDITNLSVSGTSQNSVTFSWTVPGEEDIMRKSTSHDIRYATSPLTESNWDAATQVQGEPAPGDFGASHSFTISALNTGTTYYIGIKTADELGNISWLSNVISGTTATTGNFAPVLASIGDKSAMHNALLTFVINATDADVGDTLTYSATNIPTGASFDSATQTFTWTPTISQGGTYHVTFQVTDGNVAVTETITIGLSQAPVLAAIGNKSVSENSLLSFTISATDPEGDAITYSATGLPTGATFVGRTFSWRPSYTQAGTYNVTFVASDGVAQDSETITITVNNTNRAPILDAIGDKFANESMLLTFGISATEPDGQAVAYSATGLPAGATFAGQTFSWTPSASHVGNNYPVTFTASDGQLSDSETVYITVMSDNTAPSVSNLSPAANSIQAPLNSLIILHVTDAGMGVDAGTVTITLDGGTIYTGDTSDYSSATGNCRRAGTPTDFTYAYQSSQIFDFDQSKTVTVNAADLAGNVMAERSYSFRTEMRSFSQNIRVDTTVQGINKAAPCTARDSSGNIWAVWHAGPAGSRNIYVAKLRADRNTFGASVRLTSSIADQANPALALGTDNKLYVVWQDKRNGDWDIYSSTSVDGANWTTQTRVNDPNEGNQINPAIVVDSRSPNYAYVVWQDDRAGNQDICIASSSNSFGTKTVSQITSNTANQTTPAIAVNSANTVYVLWTDARNATNDIYGAAGSPWTNVPIVTKAGSQYNPVIAVESAGMILHMLWVDQITGNSDIFYASSNGLPGIPLTGTSLIDDTLGKEQLSPAIAVTGSTGNDLKVFACWHDERNISDNTGDTDLYMVQTNSGVGTNVFVGDGDTNSDQIEPAMNTDQYGYPYLVWTDDRSANTEIYFAGSVYLQSTPLVSELTTASVGGTVGTDPASITDAEDVSVVVPAGACPYDVTISITKIEYQHEYGSLPFLNGYDFGPSGMTFNTPVTVTIPYVVTGDAGRPTVYWYDSRAWYNPLSQQGITNIETIVITSSLHALRFKTTHFTPFYILLGAAIYTAADTASSSDGGGGGGGGGCSLSHSQDGSILEYFLPYGALALFMFIFKWRDRRYRKDFDKTPLS